MLLKAIVVVRKYFLFMANWYSSRGGELIESAAVRLPTEIAQLDWQFRVTSSHFCRRSTSQCAVSAVLVLVSLEIGQLPFQVEKVPK